MRGFSISKHMKILFTADWHIKLGQKNVPIDWQKNRFVLFFCQLLGLVSAKQADAIMIGGDVFDKTPSIEELDLYFEFLEMAAETCPNTPIWIYSGNHEAVKKHTTFLTQLKRVSKSFNKNVEIYDDYFEAEDFQVIPYTRVRDKVYPVPIKRILFTHIRGAIPPHVQPEIDLERLDGWEQVFSGDLHSHSCCQRNIVYPGSPLTTSFHRSETETGVVLLDTLTLGWSFIPLELPQLIRLKVSDPSEMVATEYHHTIYELEGSVSDLAGAQVSELLDKKVIKKPSEAKLKLRADMTIREELSLYFKEVQGLNAEEVKELLQRYDDNIKESELE